jgi:hypothetical protein
MDFLMRTKGRPYPAHPPARMIQAHLGVPFTEVRWFATVRNPWSRYWGIYHHLTKHPRLAERYDLGGKSFDQFILDHEKIINAREILRKNDYLQPLNIHLAFLQSQDSIVFRPDLFSHLIRFETFNSDMKIVGEMLDIPVREIEIKHKKNTYINEMSKTAKDCIQRLCQREIEYFNYEFEEG